MPRSSHTGELVFNPKVERTAKALGKLLSNLMGYNNS
jgi:hypothetical protein